MCVRHTQVSRAETLSLRLAQHLEQFHGGPGSHTNVHCQGPSIIAVPFVPDHQPTPSALDYLSHASQQQRVYGNFVVSKGLSASFSEGFHEDGSPYTTIGCSFSWVRGYTEWTAAEREAILAILEGHD